MESLTKLNEKQFDQFEKTVLREVMDTSKSMIETFKFKLVCDMTIKQTHRNKTLKGLNEFRNKNWNNNLSTNEAYKKYMNS